MAKGLACGAVGAACGERVRLLPGAVDRAFDGLRLIGLVEHGRRGLAKGVGPASYALAFRAVNSGRAFQSPCRYLPDRPEFLLQRRRQHPRHVLVEPLLEHGTEHVLDAVLEALLRCAVRTVLSGGGTLRLAKRRGRRLPRERFARLGNALFGRALGGGLVQDWLFDDGLGNERLGMSNSGSGSSLRKAQALAR